MGERLLNPLTSAPVEFEASLQLETRHPHENLDDLLLTVLPKLALNDLMACLAVHGGPLDR